MEVIDLSQRSGIAKIAIEMGDNPHFALLDEHLRTAHGLDPVLALTAYAVAMDDHRAALVDREITLASLA